MSTLLVEAKEMFSFQQELNGETVCLIADSCQHLKKLNLDGVERVFDDDIIHIISKLGQQLNTLVLDGTKLTDAAFSCLNNCSR